MPALVNDAVVAELGTRIASVAAHLGDVNENVNENDYRNDENDNEQGRRR